VSTVNDKTMQLISFSEPAFQPTSIDGFVLGLEGHVLGLGLLTLVLVNNSDHEFTDRPILSTKKTVA